MSELTYITEDVFRPDVLALVDGAPRLVGSRCEVCGDVRFPRVLGCPTCQAPEDRLEPSVLSAQGDITTCCRIERGPKGFSPPYVVGYVQLAEGPRVLCQIEGGGGQPDQMIGKACDLIVGPLFQTEAGPVLGYKFTVRS